MIFLMPINLHKRLSFLHGISEALILIFEKESQRPE
jgi:hypothetical protein